MKINKIIFLIGAFVCAVARADTPDFMDMQSSELTARRDALRAEIAACEENTHGYKVAGIATLAATGVGVVGNIALHNKIKAAQKGNSFVSNNYKPIDTSTEQEKLDVFCKDLCKELPDEATDGGCEC